MVGRRGSGRTCGSATSCASTTSARSAAYWSVPATETTALNGSWVPGPGAKLFDAVRAELGGGPLPIVAEDLGDITDEVRDAARRARRSRDEGPAVRASTSADSEYLPHRHTENAVVYTGTHDNDTARGWYAALKPEERERVWDYLGSRRTRDPVGADPRGVRLGRGAGHRADAGRPRPRERGAHEHPGRARRQLDLARPGLGVSSRGRRSPARGWPCLSGRFPPHSLNFQREVTLRSRRE